MAINIKRIGHVGFLVSDFERSFEFYTDAIGCTVTNRRKRPDGSETAFLRFDLVKSSQSVRSCVPNLSVGQIQLS